MRSDIKKYGELDWLTDDAFVPSSVTFYSNKKGKFYTLSIGDKEDRERYERVGYTDGKPKYSRKKGKMPPYSNPYMWEGIS